MLISLKKALDLLNDPNATTLTPTLTENDNKKTFLVARKSSKETSNVNVLGNGIVKRNSRGFKFAEICRHSCLGQKVLVEISTTFTYTYYISTKC